MLSLAARNQNFLRLLGVDCFAGLPQSSTIWRNGQFNDISIENARDFFKWFEANNRHFDLLKCIKG